VEDIKPLASFLFSGVTGKNMAWHGILGEFFTYVPL